MLYVEEAHLKESNRDDKRNEWIQQIQTKGNRRGPY